MANLFDRLPIHPQICPFSNTELLREFPPEVARSDAEFQARVAFFGMLEMEERLEILDAKRVFLEALLDHLRAVGPGAEDSEHYYAAKVVGFQRSAVEHGLAWISGLTEAVRLVERSGRRTLLLRQL